MKSILFLTLLVSSAIADVYVATTTSAPTLPNPTQAPSPSTRLCCSPCSIPTCPMPTPAPTPAPTLPQETQSPTPAPTPAPTLPQTTQAPSNDCPTDYILQQFNVFAFDKIVIEQNDFEGRAAAKNSIELTDFDIGLKLNANPSISCAALPNGTYPYALVSGGSLTMNRGAVHAGHIVYGSTISKTSVSYNSDCVDSRNPDLIDFGFWKEYCVNMSMAIESLSATGSVQVGSSVSFVGSNTQSVEIFSIQASAFSAANSFSMSNINSNVHAIVINVIGGGSISFPVISYESTFSAYKSKLVWNFNGASVLNTPNIAFWGSILACDASMNTQRTGQFNGNLIINSWTAQEQVNLHATDVCLPTLAPAFNAATSGMISAHV